MLVEQKLEKAFNIKVRFGNQTHLALVNNSTTMESLSSIYGDPQHDEFCQKKNGKNLPGHCTVKRAGLKATDEIELIKVQPYRNGDIRLDVQMNHSTTSHIQLFVGMNTVLSTVIQKIAKSLNVDFDRIIIWSEGKPSIRLPHSMTIFESFKLGHLLPCETVNIRCTVGMPTRRTHAEIPSHLKIIQDHSIAIGFACLLLDNQDLEKLESDDTSTTTFKRSYLRMLIDDYYVSKTQRDVKRVRQNLTHRRHEQQDGMPSNRNFSDGARPVDSFLTNTSISRFTNSVIPPIDLYREALTNGYLGLPRRYLEEGYSLQKQGRRSGTDPIQRTALVTTEIGPLLYPGKATDDSTNPDAKLEVRPFYISEEALKVFLNGMPDIEEIEDLSAVVRTEPDLQGNDNSITQSDEISNFKDDVENKWGLVMDDTLHVHSSMRRSKTYYKTVDTMLNWAHGHTNDVVEDNIKVDVKDEVSSPKYHHESFGKWERVCTMKNVVGDVFNPWTKITKDHSNCVHPELAEAFKISLNGASDGMEVQKKLPDDAC